jgi:hypothetical protein
MVIFEKEVTELHRKIATPLFLYITRAPFLTILSAPVIYGTPPTDLSFQFVGAAGR